MGALDQGGSSFSHSTARATLFVSLKNAHSEQPPVVNSALQVIDSLRHEVATVRRDLRSALVEMRHRFPSHFLTPLRNAANAVASLKQPANAWRTEDIKSQAQGYIKDSLERGNALLSRNPAWQAAAARMTQLSAEIAELPMNRFEEPAAGTVPTA